MSIKRSFEHTNFSKDDNSELLDNGKNEIHSMPLKRYYRSRAHCNPLSHNDGFKYPLSPEAAGIRNPNRDRGVNIIVNEVSRVSEQSKRDMKCNFSNPPLL